MTGSLGSVMHLWSRMGFDSPHLHTNPKVSLRDQGRDNKQELFTDSASVQDLRD